MYGMVNRATEGLITEPFVAGGPEGLARRFGMDITVEHVVRRTDGVGREEFFVARQERKAGLL